MSFFPWIFTGALLGSLYVFPIEAAEAAREGLHTFSTFLLPTLGPSMALCLYLCSRLPGKRTLQIPASLLCGSPGGARILQENRYTTKGALHDAALTGVLSPQFFLSTLSGWLGNPSKAYLVYFCHIAGALLSALCIRKENVLPNTAAPLSLPECVYKAALSLLQVGYYVMLGTVAARMAASAFPDAPPFLAGCIQCLLEITGGAKCLIGLYAPLPLLCFFLSFGGLSILLQNAAFWKESGVSAFHLAGVRLMHGFFSGILCFFLQKLPFFG